MENTNKTLYMYISTAMMTTITVICAWITIPLPFTPVPINLATLAVFISGGLLGAKYGALSQAIYILCGAVGLPVFAGFSGGAGVIAGPTGGFIIGYIVCALLVGLISFRHEKSSAASNIRLIFSFIAGLISCYTLGMCWFMLSTGANLKAGLIACVIPFIPGDALKIALAMILTQKLRKIL